MLVRPQDARLGVSACVYLPFRSCFPAGVSNDDTWGEIRSGKLRDQVFELAVETLLRAQYAHICQPRVRSLRYYFLYY